MIYVPTDEFAGQSLGKDVPGMGPFKNYTPKLQGPGSGKIKAAIYAAQLGYRYFKRNPRFGARIGAVAGGAGVSYYFGKTQANGPYRKTRSSIQSRYYSKRNARNKNADKCCCCTKHHSRGKRRFYR